MPADEAGRGVRSRAHRQATALVQHGEPGVRGHALLVCGGWFRQPCDVPFLAYWHERRRAFTISFLMTRALVVDVIRAVTTGNDVYGLLNAFLVGPAIEQIGFTGSTTAITLLRPRRELTSAPTAQTEHSGHPSPDERGL